MTRPITTATNIIEALHIKCTNTDMSMFQLPSLGGNVILWNWNDPDIAHKLLHGLVLMTKQMNTGSSRSCNCKVQNIQTVQVKMP